MKTSESYVLNDKTTASYLEQTGPQHNLSKRAKGERPRERPLARFSGMCACVPGGNPIYKGRGCSSEILKRTPNSFFFNFFLFLRFLSFTFYTSKTVVQAVESLSFLIVSARRDRSIKFLPRSSFVGKCKVRCVRIFDLHPP